MEHCLDRSAYLCQQHLVQVALLPSRALKGISPVHEGIPCHACCPFSLNWGQPEPQSILTGSPRMHWQQHSVLLTDAVFGLNVMGGQIDCFQQSQHTAGVGRG